MNNTQKAIDVKNVTRKDIAKMAGVSLSVVSRSLNNSGYVKKEKKKRVLAIANKLGYIPSPVATALRQSRTHQLLFFCGDLTGSYYLQMYHGMARQAEKRGYHILAIMNEHEFMLAKRTLVDGVLFPTEIIAQNYAETVGKSYYLPTVTACFDPSFMFVKPMPMVIIDNYKVVNMAIDYLVERGHRRIGMALPFNEGYANLRFRYWKDRMTQEIGEDSMHYLIDIHGDLKISDTPKEDSKNDFLYEVEGFEYVDLFFAGKEAAKVYVKSAKKSSAVLCFNDDLAFGMIEGLKEEGLSVPEDVSIMGIDGVFTRSRYIPALTTIAIYPERQGAKCVDILINMIEEKDYNFMNYSAFKVLEGETVKRY